MTGIPVRGTFPIRGGTLNAGDVLLFPVNGDPDPCILRRTPDDPQAVCIREDHTHDDPTPP